ncbi:hypothetical protein KSP39_PZI019839 [Platanthera zijinensis]|uniref:Uncharacterized protein n=1 Tax=Platanthera zijinensis TaxID=2320716 RepID=A0AAP0FY34_9ASPA
MPISEEMQARLEATREGTRELDLGDAPWLARRSPDLLFRPKKEKGSDFPFLQESAPEDWEDRGELGHFTLLITARVPGGFESSDYLTERKWAVSTDSTKCLFQFYTKRTL